jgi:hypothetical protein
VDNSSQGIVFECVAPKIRFGLGGQKLVSGVVANLPVADIEAARDFYTEYLRFSFEGINMG